MAEMMSPGPVDSSCAIREAVCVHTKKILDSCRDQDCIEDLRVYFDQSNQKVIDEATSIKAGGAELLRAYIDVEPVGFNRGFFTVDVRYYYRITAEAGLGPCRPTQVSGLAMFQKRCVLYGGEGGAKVFSSQSGECPITTTESVPEAVVEVVDPLVLCIKMVDSCDCHCCDSCDCCCLEIPRAVADCLPEPLMTGGCSRKVYISLGQFSILRLERDAQLLMPVYDDCVPCKECACADGDCQKDPCELFQKVQFPMDAFFPHGNRPDNNNCGCGCNCR